MPIVNTDIEYTGMTRLPMMMQIFIKTHVKHNVGPAVDKSCSHEGISVYLRRAIEYVLILGRFTLQT